MKRVLILNLVALSLAAPVYAGEFAAAEGQRLQVGDEVQPPAVQAASHGVEKSTLGLVVEWPKTVGYATNYIDKVGQGAPAP